MHGRDGDFTQKWSESGKTTDHLLDLRYEDVYLRNTAEGVRSVTVYCKNVT
jgi:hypothetical protein